MEVPFQIRRVLVIALFEAEFEKVERVNVTGSCERAGRTITVQDTKNFLVSSTS